MCECKMNNIGDIVIDYLKKNKYDGLFNPDNGCGCSIDYLVPCEDISFDCLPAYKVKSHCDNCEIECDGRGILDYCYTIVEINKESKMTTKSGSRCHYDLEGEFIPCGDASKMTGQMTPGGYMRTTPSRWLSQFNYCPFCGTYLDNLLIIDRERKR